MNMGEQHFKSVIQGTKNKTKKYNKCVIIHRVITYQADEDEDKLYKICVGHRVEASHQCVGDGYGCRDPNANPEGQI